MVSVCDNHSYTEAKFAHRISTFYILFGGCECVCAVVPFGRTAANASICCHHCLTPSAVGLSCRVWQHYSHSIRKTYTTESAPRRRGREIEGETKMESRHAKVMSVWCCCSRCTNWRLAECIVSSEFNANFFPVVFDALNFTQKWIELRSRNWLKRLIVSFRCLLIMCLLMLDGVRVTVRTQL